MNRTDRPEPYALDTQLDALANPLRRGIFERLVRGPASVSELAKAAPVSRPAVSQHLKVLKQAGLVHEQRLGRRAVYRARREGLADLRRYVDTLTPSSGGSAPVTGSAARDHIDDAMTNWARKGLRHDPAAVATIVRLMMLTGIMERLYAKTAADHGLTKGDVVILGTIRRSDGDGGLTPSEIASTALFSRPDIARRLLRLEDAGMIERRPQTSDQRSHRVRLTRRGEIAIDTIAETQFERSYKPFFDLPAEQRLAFDGVLRHLLAAIEAERIA